MFKRFKDEVNDSGKAAEEYAQRFLKSQKLSIIKTNHVTPRGELDIIARDGEAIVFVEVRMRSKNHFGSAADSISTRKQQSLIYAATHYLQSTQQWDKVSCRFDAICLSPQESKEESKSGTKKKYQVEWIRNAFNAN